MRLSEVWRTTTFRLSLLYGLLFAIGTVALLALVYVRSAVYLTQRVDRILASEAAVEMALPPAALRQTIDDALIVNGRNSMFALFSPDGVWLTGNLHRLPAGLQPGGRPIEIEPTHDFPASARLVARTLPSGEVLVVGRDVSQLREIRRIIASALIWSGVLIIVAGLACGVALSVGPLRRLRRLQEAGQDIAAGDLKRRMPSSGQGDELDMFAGTVNYMMGEVERLMAEVKTSSDTIAHDLRTPLTRLRFRIESLPDDQKAKMSADIDQMEEMISAALTFVRDASRPGERTPLELSSLLESLCDEMAETGASTEVESGEKVVLEGDPMALRRLFSNLLENAVKFGGRARARVFRDASNAFVEIEDDGPGIPPSDREKVFEPFYRREPSRSRQTGGIGLGLAVVRSIARGHGGDVDLVNRAGGGLTARVQLPL